MSIVKQVAKWTCIAVAVSIAAWVALGERLVDALRPRLTGALATQLDMPVDLQELDVDLLASRVVLRGARVGGAAPLVDAEEIVVDLRARSIVEARIAVAVRLRRTSVDLRKLPAGSDQQSDASAPALPFDLDLQAEHLQVRFDDVSSVDAAALQLEVQTGAAPQVLFATALSAATLHWENRRAEISDAAVRGQWHEGRLSIEEVRVDGPAIGVRGGPAQAGTDTGGLVPLPIEIDAALEPWLSFFAGSPYAGGRVHGAATIGGELGDPLVSGTFTLEDARLQGRSLGRLSAGMDRRSGIWRFGDLKVAGPLATIHGELTVDEDTGRVDGNLGWQGVDIEGLAGRPRRFGVTLSGRGELHVDAYEQRFSGDGSGDVAGGAEPLAYELHLLRRGGQTSGQLAASVDRGAVVRADVERLLDAGGIDGTVKIEIASIDTAGKALGLTFAHVVDGSLSGEAILRSSTQPEISLRLTSPGLSLDGQPVGALAVAADLTDRAAVVQSLKLTNADSAVEGGGVVALTDGESNRWWLRSDGRDVGSLVDLVESVTGVDVPQVAGVLSGRIDVSGTWASPQVRGAFASADTEIATLQVGEVKIDVDGDADAWVVGARAAGAASASAELRLRGAGTAVASVEAKVPSWPLAALPAVPSDVSGTLSLAANVAAGPAGSSGTIEMRVVELAAGGVEMGDSSLEAAGENGTWSARGGLFGGAAELAGTVARDGTVSGTATWRQLVLPVLSRGSEALEARSSGAVEVRGNTALLDQARVSVSVDDLELSGGPEKIAFAPIRGTIDGGALVFEPFAVRGSRTRLEARGTAAANGDAELALSGTVALPWLEYFAPGVAGTKGQASVDLLLESRRGALAALAGKIGLRDGGVEIEGLPPADKVGADLSLSLDGAVVHELHGELGGGRFTIEGDIGRETGPALSWRMLRVALDAADSLEVVVSGEGKVQGAWDDALLAGDVSIDELHYDRDLRFQDLIPSFDRTLDPPPAQADQRPPLRCDLRIRARDGMYVENNIANLEARTDLHLSGSLRAPELRGELAVVDGRILLRGRTFEIVNGVLTFKPELRGEAAIDFLAESIIETSDLDYAVEVRVAGTTDDYRVSLSANDGTLSQADIASLIALGKTVAQMRDGGSAGGGLSVDSIAGLAGGQLGKVLSGELLPVLPFDEVQLRPGFSPSTGELEPQIRVGKRLADDLFAWITQSFGVQSRTAVEVNYDLGRQIATVLRWESQTASQEGAFGGELTQRFEFWRLPKWLSWGRRHE